MFVQMCSTGKGRGPNLPYNNVPRRDVSSGVVPLRGFLRPSLGPRHNHHLSLGHQTEVESSSRRRTRPILLETNRHEPPQRPRKGHGHLYPSRRISNGDVAEVGQFPWQVALSIDRHTACGASLISEEWVLTAAHCIYKSVKYSH
uniref:(California timema) hypothetical protein n=1 Tax=Timema californicum TaxID=61474 RepID=A0A7R9JHT8_TIMCA|nr:unnamed protein product [Timema californicum]